MSERTPRGRYAPSPTGRLHLGNARTALVAWLSVRSAGGRFVWRVEDLDSARTIDRMESDAMEDLAWLGIDWDEGPDCGGPFGPYRQSERTDLYERALRRLLASGRIFPCRRSRKDLLDLATAPHGEASSPYPVSLRPENLPAGWYDRTLASRDAAVRFVVHDRPVVFRDLVTGEHEEIVSATVGDFVLRRRDDVYAYQLAVVVDDLAMHITEVVRGRDLLDSTARQLQLIEALGGRVPAYAHVPLVLNADGEKISKRDSRLTLDSFRAAGARPERLVGYLAWSLGLLNDPDSVTPYDLLNSFSWERIKPEDWTVSSDVVSRLASDA